MAIGSVTIVSSGTVKEGPGTVGTRVMDKAYPAVEGLIAGSTKQTKKPNL